MAYALISWPPPWPAYSRMNFLWSHLVSIVAFGSLIVAVSSAELCQYHFPKSCIIERFLQPLIAPAELIAGAV